MDAAVPDRASALALEYRAGREGALEALYAELAPQLAPVLGRYRARRGMLPGALEFGDLVQQSWIIIAELARRWRPEQGSFGAYTRGSFGWALARYVKAHAHERRWRSVQVLSLDHDEVAELLNTHTSVDGRLWSEAVAFRELLEHLSEPERQVFLLHRVEGLPVTEVARRLGTSRWVVDRRLRRAECAALAWEQGEPFRRVAPGRHQAALERLVVTLHQGAKANRALPGRRWICTESGLSQVSYARLMARLVRAGCLAERSPRRPGRLVDPTPAATLRRLRAFEASLAASRQAAS